MLVLGSEWLDLSRRQSVLRIHGTGLGEKRVSDKEGDPSLVLVPDDRIAAERFPVERVLVERVVLERVPAKRVPVGRVASCHPIHEHRKDSACHLGVDPSHPSDDHSEKRWDLLD